MRALMAGALILIAAAAQAETVPATVTPITEWKAVYGRIEARDLVPARARIGGTITELLVSEGDSVVQGQTIAVVADQKIAFQIAAIDAQMAALRSQLGRAESELARGQTLVDRGVTTIQRLDQLKTEVDVFRNQMAAAEAQKSVLLQQQKEGEVLAPLSGRVITKPVTRGGVVMGGEPVATIGGGGFFLRLAVPERHAANLKEAAAIRVTTDAGESVGRLVKIYPQIENGRVIADVEVPELRTAFVNARALVKLPVGERQALLVPAASVVTRFGIDFVTVELAGKRNERAVITGDNVQQEGRAMVEILSGLSAGDQVIVP